MATCFRPIRMIPCLLVLCACLALPPAIAGDTLPALVQSLVQTAEGLPGTAYPLVPLTPLRRPRFPGDCAHVSVIMYHDVRPTKEVWFDVTTDEFRRQMEQLRAAHASVIRLSDLVAHLTTGRPLPPCPILLTFDDGYLGDYTNAFPILQEFHYPAVFFVHTAMVGKRSDRRHLSWDQLREVERSGLVTVMSHTRTHPEDMTKLTDAQLDDELGGSRSELEAELGHPVTVLAYPDGSYDGRVMEAAERAGYQFAFTTERGDLGEASSPLALNRFGSWRLTEAIQAASQPSGPLPPMRPPGSVFLSEHRLGRVDLLLIHGGRPITAHYNYRLTVGDIVRKTGGVAGINGGFFSMAAVNGTSGEMIGPCLSQTEGKFLPGQPADLPKLAGRPLVLISHAGMRIVPFDPATMDTRDQLNALLPGLTDCFVAGAWLVQGGRALDTDEIARGVASHAEIRRRAFFGVDAQGLPVIGATRMNLNGTDLARALGKLGLREAVMLDCGFSTSLLYHGAVLVTGHTAPHLPSRPVPHAIVLLPPLSNAPVQASLADTPGLGLQPVPAIGEMASQAVRDLLGTCPVATHLSLCRALLGMPDDGTVLPTIPPPAASEASSYPIAKYSQGAATGLSVNPAGRERQNTATWIDLHGTGRRDGRWSWRRRRRHKRRERAGEWRKRVDGRW